MTAEKIAGVKNFPPNCKKRKVKRVNLDSCKFRIKFLFNESQNFYYLDSASNFQHNHSPGGSNSKNSIEVIIMCFYAHLIF